MWASQLRVDQPLMIAECLRSGLFPESDPCIIAALIAAFVYDREIEIEFGQSMAPKELASAYITMEKELFPFTERKRAQGFQVRTLPLWTAATMYAWASGVEWEKVLEIADMTEGDLAMLVSRTADNLRQVASLGKFYPAIASAADQAITLILKEPAVYD